MLMKRRDGSAGRARLQGIAAGLASGVLDRRTFLRRSGLAAGAGAALGLMPLEESRLFAEVSFEIAAREAAHDLKQDRDVIFRLPRRACALDPERTQIFANTRQRALMKKASQIIGGIGKQVAATEPDEQIKELLADGAIIRR